MIQFNSISGADPDVGPGFSRRSSQLSRDAGQKPGGRLKARPHRHAAPHAPRYSIGLTPQPNALQAKQPPRVSVVVVSRNRAALLRRCLDSLEQSDARPTLQVIVVDNGSSDGSAQLDSAFPAAQFVPF